MNQLRIIAAIIALSAAFWWLDSRPQKMDSSDHSVPVGVNHLASVAGHATLPISFDGLAVQVSTSYKPVETYTRLVDEVAALGAQCVMFSVNGYQEHAGSSRIYIDSDKTPSPDDWQSIFSAARRRDMRIVLMPKILLAKPRGSEWRGVIQPTNWNTWFDEYRKFLITFADMAQRNRIDLFLIGSELISAEKFTDQWKRTIAEVRRVYGGPLCYSANWDHYRGIRFWDDVDVIGMTTYYELSKEPSPTAEHLQSRWQEIKRDILEWRQTVNRPILFTEAGWASQEGCSVEPWNYYRQKQCTPAGLEEQRRNYAAFLDAWTGEPDVAGIIWWEWTPGAGGHEDYGYTPKGKPAEQVLRKWFQMER